MLMLGIGGQNCGDFQHYNGLFCARCPFAEIGTPGDLDEAAPNWNLGISWASRTPISSHGAAAIRVSTAWAFFPSSAFNLSGNGQSQRVKTAKVTYDLLDVLRFETGHRPATSCGGGPASAVRRSH